jgi:hypothetical protein
VNQHVGVINQLAKDFSAFILLEVEAQGPLITTNRSVIAAHIFAGGADLVEIPHNVASGRSLNLNYVGAVIPKHLPGKWHLHNHAKL